jgi:hypothetical protein
MDQDILSNTPVSQTLFEYRESCTWRLTGYLNLCCKKSVISTACFRMECPPTAHLQWQMGTKHPYLRSLLFSLADLTLSPAQPM